MSSALRRRTKSIYTIPTNRFETFVRRKCRARTTTRATINRLRAAAAAPHSVVVNDRALSRNFLARRAAANGKATTLWFWFVCVFVQSECTYTLAGPRRLRASIIAPKQCTMHRCSVDLKANTNAERTAVVWLIRLQKKTGRHCTSPADDREIRKRRESIDSCMPRNGISRLKYVTALSVVSPSRRTRNRTTATRRRRRRERVRSTLANYKTVMAAPMRGANASRSSVFAACECVKRIADV